MANNEPGRPSNPAQARAALDRAERAGNGVTENAAAPWWYHVGLAISPAFLFASVSLGEGYRFLGALCAILSSGLVIFASRRSGVAIDRNRIARGARGKMLAYVVFVIVAAGAGMYLEMGADLRWSMALAGASLIIPGFFVSRSNDAALCREVRRGQ